MHVPAAAVVTAEPATVHTGVVPELNDTGSPDDADADKVTGAPTDHVGQRPERDRLRGCIDLERLRHVRGRRVQGAITEAPAL